MADPMDEETIDRLKASLWFAVGKIVEEESLRLNTSATPQFIGALTEMVWEQIKNVSQDLESFAQHAGRTTINTADVLLVTRRNDALHDMIREFVEKEEAKSTAAKEKGVRGKGTTVARGRGRGRK